MNATGFSFGRKPTDGSSFRSEKTFEMSSDQDDFSEIVERFGTLEEVCKAIQKEGVDNVGLIFGIDYTLSNRMQGAKTFGHSLHELNAGQSNPYQEVICILGETLEPLDEEGMIDAFGFGDFKVKDKGCFPLKLEGPCEGFSEVLDVYNERTKDIKLGGPTNFAPLIEEAIGIVQKSKQFKLLVIVADGQVTKEDDTIAAIIKASDYPMSIILIGVGDGPWDVMTDFDFKLPTRKFDNFHFVDFHKVKTSSRNPQAAVALAALMQVPDAYKSIKELGLLDKLQRKGGR